MDNKYVTICTPTYNRCDKLPILYSSLRKQNSKDFEWLLVDDGSNDQTKDYIQSLNCELFPIRYIKKENGGKHTALNVGIKEAKGTVFAIVDSDDYLLENAVEKLIEWFDGIKQFENFAGVAGQKGYNENKATGSFYQGDYVDASSSERDNYKIQGDKFEVFYTEILRQFPFPEIKGERFLTEAVVWNRIANAGYKLRWYKDILYICEYLESGLTSRKDKLVKNSPQGYALYIKELVAANISFKKKLGYYSYYYSVRKEDAGIKQIAQELSCNVIILKLSSITRCLLYALRR